MAKNAEIEKHAEILDAHGCHDRIENMVVVHNVKRPC